MIGELEGRDELELVLDGEIVALNAQGLPDFGLLQRSSGFGPGSSTRRNDD